jgi:ferredoxin
MKICPTSGLQPALAEAGAEGIWTPVLMPRRGYCEYGCSACGEICPSDAIPTLTLEAKRTQVLGLARIDKDRCLPWAYDTPCIVCEEMCPIPEKAIRLEETIIRDKEGNEIRLQRPRVMRDLCIGCGICEYRCPMGGEAAIRVFHQEPL